jgi:hypothetical protein
MIISSTKVILLWKQIVDKKYSASSPNNFCSDSTVSSHFWKGVMWAAQAVKFGYRWTVGDGKKNRFLGGLLAWHLSLVDPIWEIYSVCHENCQTISEVWDGCRLKLTFRRNFSLKMMEQWYALESIAQGIILTSDTNSLSWTYSNSGVYSTSSLYAIINFRGVQPIHVPAIWKLILPPRVQFFTWMVINNRIMTRDNLKKRNLNKPETCVFCSCNESVQHLFFDCIVAKLVWNEIADFFGKLVGANLDSIAHYWFATKVILP